VRLVALIRRLLLRGIRSYGFIVVWVGNGRAILGVNRAAECIRRAGIVGSNGRVIHGSR
jgi:hypothetical protein